MKLPKGLSNDAAAVAASVGVRAALALIIPALSPQRPVATKAPTESQPDPLTGRVQRKLRTKKPAIPDSATWTVNRMSPYKRGTKAARTYEMLTNECETAGDFRRRCRASPTEYESGYLAHAVEQGYITLN